MKSMCQQKIYLFALVSSLCLTPAVAHTQVTHLKPNANLPTQYIIKFKDKIEKNKETTSPSSAMSSEQLAEHTIQQLNLTSSIPIGHHNAYTAQLSASQLAQLKNNPNVEYIEPDYPNYFISQQLGDTVNTTSSPAPSSINWEPKLLKANNISDKDASNRTICIIDSGYAINHPALVNNNVSGIDVTESGSWDAPSISHGSHVAGIIAAMQPASSTDDKGMRGIMPNGQINIFAVKVSGSNGSILTSDIIKAVDVCIDHNANIITMSLGKEQFSKLEEQTYKKAQKAGVLIVAAAGNGGDLSNFYPASYKEVMSIASVDSNMAHSAFSQSNTQVEISAPGEAILSSVIPGDGRLADIKIGKQSYFANGVVPLERNVSDGNGKYIVKDINGSIQGEIALCQEVGGSYQCGDMTDKVCLIQRQKDQQRNKSPDSIDDIYPEFQPVMACQNAGAKAAIIYSSNNYSGLQNPFLVDASKQVSIPTVSVSKVTGTELKAKVGQIASVSVSAHQDYAYYNGTSMATPYVAAVSALVWSKHPECNATQVRSALDKSATHLGTSGRNIQFGYGLVNAKDTDKLLGQSCGEN